MPGSSVSKSRSQEAGIGWVQFQAVLELVARLLREPGPNGTRPVVHPKRARSFPTFLSDLRDSTAFSTIHLPIIPKSPVLPIVTFWTFGQLATTENNDSKDSVSRSLVKRGDQILL